MSAPSATGPAPGPASGVAAVIVAAGRGTRAASPAGGPAKQYARIGSSTVLGRTLAAFAGHGRVGSVLTVIAAGDETAYRSVAASLDGDAAAKLLPPATGGQTRQSSVGNGLEALAAGGAPDKVLIHDAARPFVSDALIDSVIDALSRADGALPILPLSDTVKRLDGARIAGTEDRSRLGAAQTPQGFAFHAILEAHRRARAAGRTDFTDDAAVGEWAGLSLLAVAGDPSNAKITSALDLEDAARRLSGHAGLLETRVATGFDVHAFGPGKSVRLCGIDVAHEKGLLGHSDADVALHAITDALYGTIGAADIGFHFPPSDARWKGVDSAVFLQHARGEVERRGGHIVHVDLTIVCERPKVGPHRAAMVARLATLLGLDQDRISVKATTTERLGFAGRGEGIAAQAVATVALPPRP